MEAANYAVRFSPKIRAWFQRKQSRSGKRLIAAKSLTNKPAKAGPRRADALSSPARVRRSFQTKAETG